MMVALIDRCLAPMRVPPRLLAMEMCTAATVMEAHDTVRCQYFISSLLHKDVL